MNLRQTLLLVVIVLLSGLGAAVFMHPQGADGVRNMLGLDTAEASQTASSGVAQSPIPKHRRTATQLQNGDEAYDAGNFSGAQTFYAIAGITDDLSQRDAARRGAQRSVLAEALIDDTPAPDLGGQSEDERLAEVRRRAELEQTEAAWLELVLLASGTGRAAELPPLVDTLLDIASTGGPVEKRLQAVLRNRVRNSKQLAAAMSAIGLDHGGMTGHLVADLGNDLSDEFGDDLGDDSARPRGASGIGSSNRNAARHHVAFGDFPRSFRGKLEEASMAEFEGLKHADAAGPDGTERPMHRREAKRLLTIARDIYNEALEIDPDSVDVQKHVKMVVLALSQVRKSSTFSD